MKSFLVFSDDWAAHPSSCQHIFKHIAKQYPVVWVNTVGMRTPTFSFYDLKKIITKVKKMVFYNRKPLAVSGQDMRLNVLQPFMLPFLRAPFVNFFNRFFVSRSVNNALKELGIFNPILVVTAPNAVEYLKLFRAEKVVYYSVDDFSEWAGLDRDIVRKMEEHLIAQADVHIATSDNLFSRIEKYGKCPIAMSHGVDVDFFSRKPAREHPLLENIPSPRVGYYGLFDRRSDFDLLSRVADLMPHISFVITGDVQVDISALRKFPNIYFTGSVPYDEIPSVAHGFDVCMLPYLVDKTTDSIQPLKLKEYIAAGKPIISTPIKEAGKYRDFVALATTADEWTCLIRELLEDSAAGLCKKRIDYLCRESWECKADLFLKYCLK